MRFQDDGSPAARPCSFTAFNTFISTPGETWVVGSTAAVEAEGTTGSCAAAGKYQVVSLTGTTVYVEGGPGALPTNGTAGLNAGCAVEERCHMTP